MKLYKKYDVLKYGSTSLRDQNCGVERADRQTDRHTNTHTHTQTDTQTDTQNDSSYHTYLLALHITLARHHYYG